MDKQETILELKRSLSHLEKKQALENEISRSRMEIKNQSEAIRKLRSEKNTLKSPPPITKSFTNECAVREEINQKKRSKQSKILLSLSLIASILCVYFAIFCSSIFYKQASFFYSEYPIDQVVMFGIILLLPITISFGWKSSIQLGFLPSLA